jgi:hypothetical protein
MTPWHPTPTFAYNVIGGPALIESRWRNFEVVVPIPGGRLQHWWRDNGDPMRPWHPTETFAYDVDIAARPALIESRWRNFEVVVPLSDGRLQHWYRDNAHPLKQWRPTQPFASDVSPFARGVALIQSNLGTEGDFEVVFLEGDSRLQHWYRDNDDPGKRWKLRQTFTSGISQAGSIPALIQSSFGTQGDFELVFRDVGSGLQHWSRDNDAPNPLWRYRSYFADNASYRPALIQSSFGRAQRNFEVIRKITTGPLEHWWCDNDSPARLWNARATFGSGYSLP